MNFNPAIYEYLESFADVLILWIFAFTLLNIGRIFFHLSRGQNRLGHNSVIVELAGMPLVLLQTVGFFKAVETVDYLSMLLFVWWGPGFFATVFYLAYCKVSNRVPDWQPTKNIISWLCKINYLAFMVVFYLLDKPGMMFVYSVWIINDQFGLAFLSLDADRLRRTFDDYWFVRILYPLGLFVPFFYSEIPFRSFCMAYGGALLLLWIFGIGYVKYKGRLNQFPDDPTLLRNMVYFSRTHSNGSNCKPRGET